jgi:hypothetical protein
MAPKVPLPLLVSAFRSRTWPFTYLAVQKEMQTSPKRAIYSTLEASCSSSAYLLVHRHKLLAVEPHIVVCATLRSQKVCDVIGVLQTSKARNIRCKRLVQCRRVLLARQRHQQTHQLLSDAGAAGPQSCKIHVDSGATCRNKPVVWPRQALNAPHHLHSSYLLF